MGLTNELKAAEGKPFPEIYRRFNEIASRADGLSMGQITSAFARATGQDVNLNNPYIQNRRVKEISSLPRDYSKDDVAGFLRAPDGNEQPLREVEHGLEYTAYPLWHLRKTYQELLTYHNYVAPAFLEEADAGKDDFWREWRLLEKLREELDPKAAAHQIAGQVLQEGKVFYVPRVSVDKVHNNVNYAFLQQLPSDWTKIVGFNNQSRYTVAFNLFYFLQPGTTPGQFGDLFDPYLRDFAAVVSRGGAKRGKQYVYAEFGVDFARFNARKEAGTMAGDPEAYQQNGRWFYWVTLPIDRVFTFEADDATRTAVSPFTGLFISMIQMAQYEQIQLELVQNPLIAVMTGEIPYYDSGATTEDTYRLSHAARQLFEALWYQMMSQNNTSGIGLYFAPVSNIQMHTLAEAPGATEISGNGYAYTMNKAGVSGIIPVSDDARAGIAQISFKIESRFAALVYRQFENMMRRIFQGLRLKYSWKFVMFGTLEGDEKLEDSARQGMTLGILGDTLTYLALHERSFLDDLAVSRAVMKSGVMDLRIPLVSTYSAKQGESGLPPQAKSTLDPGGRPGTDKAETGGREQDMDA